MGYYNKNTKNDLDDIFFVFKRHAKKYVRAQTMTDEIRKTKISIFSNN